MHENTTFKGIQDETTVLVHILHYIYQRIPGLSQNQGEGGGFQRYHGRFSYTKNVINMRCIQSEMLLKDIKIYS